MTVIYRAQSPTPAQPLSSSITAFLLCMKAQTHEEASYIKDYSLAEVPIQKNLSLDTGMEWKG